MLELDNIVNIILFGWSFEVFYCFVIFLVIKSGYIIYNVNLK